MNKPIEEVLKEAKNILEGYNPERDYYYTVSEQEKRYFFDQNMSQILDEIDFLQKCSGRLDGPKYSKLKIENEELKRKIKRMESAEFKRDVAVDISRALIDKLEQQNKILVEALEFYRNKNRWIRRTRGAGGQIVGLSPEWSDVEQDGGKIAQEALKKVGEM